MTAGPALLVAGHVNLDRIWELDGPLRAGARLQVGARRLRLGGGGANTALALAALGARPVLAARLADDAAAEAMLSWLSAAGVDVAAVERRPGVTTPSDILLDTAGERTLLGHAKASQPAPAALADWRGTHAYVNASRLADPAVLQPLCARAVVVAQMPLDATVSRPAQVLIASRSDIGDRSAESLWRQRTGIDSQLRHLVVTAGAVGAEIVGAGGVQAVPLPDPPVPGDTTGAGDFFAAGLLLALSTGAGIEAAVVAGQHAARALLLQRPPALALWRTLPGLS